MNNKESLKLKTKENKASWAALLKLYKRVKIPWFSVVCVLLLSLAMKEAESRLVPYTTKIMTGAIDMHGFLGGFIVLTIFVGVIEALQGGVNELGAAITTRNVRKTVWRKLINLPMSVYDKEDNQSFVSRITQDTTGAYAAISCVVQLVAVVYGLYTNFAKMFKVYDKLALIMLTAIPITFLVSWICGKMQFKMEKIVIDSVSAITNFFGERLPNLLHIKTSNMEDEEYLKGVEANNAKYKADVQYLSIFIVQGPLGTFAQYINEVILLVVATALVRQGVMKMSQMLNLYNYFILFMGNAILLTAVWQGVKKSHGSCSTIAKICEIEDENLKDGMHLDTEQKDIRFENVTFAYEEGNNVLKGVSFTVPSGKITAIVGENGSGKSTVVRLLERFNNIDSGKIMLGDDDFYDINLFDWRSKVGHLFQGDQIVKGSIRDNICYGLDREISEEELIEAAKKAKAYSFITEKEDGFDTQVSKFTTKLSGGEMQRLAIARIMLQKPEILLMDEATSGIDVVNESDIVEALYNLMEGKTVIMIAHDMKMIEKVDNIVVLNNGVVEASGDYDTVLSESPLFRSYTNERSVV